MTSYQWNPTPDGIDQANVTRLARAHGLAGIDELRARSVADTAWYWDAAAADLVCAFARRTAGCWICRTELNIPTGSWTRR